MKIKQVLNTPITDVARDIRKTLNKTVTVGQAIIGAGIMTVSSMGVTQTIVNIDEKTQEKARKTEMINHKTDSIMQARGMSVFDINGRLQVQNELKNNNGKGF